MLAIIGGTGMTQLACLENIAQADYENPLWRAIRSAHFWKHKRQ